MNESRFNAIYRGLPTQAKKIFDAMPPKVGVGIVKLMTELRSRHPSMCDYQGVMSCMQALLSSGLVTEKVRGEFVRVAVAPKEQPERPATNIQPTLMPKAKQPEPQMPKDTTQSPIDRLGAIASRLREITKDVEDAALEMAAQAEKDGLETAKLRQLQTLLKSLS